MPKLRYVKGELCVTTEAKDLVFPDKNGGPRFISTFPSRIEQAEDPFLQEALERSDYEAFTDAAPRGPTYPLWVLAVMAEVYAYEHEPFDDRIPEGLYEDGEADDSNDTRRDPIFPYYEENPDPLGACDDSGTCRCHGSVCTLACDIKVRGSKPSSTRIKFVRGHVPLACGMCPNTFG